MIVEEDSPGLAPWSSRTHVPHVLLDRTFAEVKPQLEEFATDPFRSPQAIVPCHLLDQRHDVCGDLRFGRSRSGLVLPIQPEFLAMPVQEGRLPG